MAENWQNYCKNKMVTFSAVKHDSHCYKILPRNK